MAVRRIIPGPGQESVWDYPRPPRLEPVDRRVQVVFAGITVAESDAALRVCETSHPPTYYLPPQDIADGVLRSAQAAATWCEWKGFADYLDVVAGGRAARRAAWTYRRPTRPFAALRDHVAFYAGSMDVCRVGDVEAEPQPGGFYGGWVTPDVVGPFKGERGTLAW
jgi:uncharacterized protein (DUF427 family)